jgi:hypothetical protein
MYRARRCLRGGDVKQACHAICQPVPKSQVGSVISYAIRTNRRVSRIGSAAISGIGASNRSGCLFRYWRNGFAGNGSEKSLKGSPRQVFTSVARCRVRFQGQLGEQAP